MKTRIATAVASVIIASMGTVAYAQTTPQTTPPTTPPASTPYTNATQSNPTMGNNHSTMGNTSNDRIEKKIKQELTQHGITATNVNVSFSDGTATLSGTVATQSDISKAKKDAMRVRGVKHVDTTNLQARAQSPQHQQ